MTGLLAALLLALLALILFLPEGRTFRRDLLARLRPAPDQAEALREDIAEVLEAGHSAGVVEKAARDRLLGALDLSDRTVEEVMRPRQDIEMIDADLPPDDIIAKVLASRHSRLPLYRERPDNIIGTIHAKDLLREAERMIRTGHRVSDVDVNRVIAKPYYVPETTALDEQMREFLARRVHFALVVDEYGDLQGLITLEDILEEIVGEITDEFDAVARPMALEADTQGDYEVDGSMTIRDLNRAMDWALPDDAANTVAGLVIHEAQTIPNEGQIFQFHGFRFEILQRKENRITRLKLRRL